MTEEHLKYVNRVSETEDYFTPVSQLRKGRSETLKGIEQKKDHIAKNSPVSKKDLESRIKSSIKESGINITISDESMDSNLRGEVDQNFIEEENLKRQEKPAYPKGGHKPRTESNIVYSKGKSNFQKINNKLKNQIHRLLESSYLEKKSNSEFLLHEENGGVNNLRISENECACSCSRYHKNPDIMCPHIISSLVFLGVKDDYEENLNDFEKKIVSQATQKFSKDKCKDFKDRFIQIDRATNSSKLLPALRNEGKSVAKVNTLKEAQDFIKENQTFKWFLLRESKNNKTCPSHDHNDERKKIQSGALVYCVHHLRIAFNF